MSSVPSRRSRQDISSILPPHSLSSSSVLRHTAATIPVWPVCPCWLCWRRQWRCQNVWPQGDWLPVSYLMSHVTFLTARSLELRLYSHCFTGITNLTGLHIRIFNLAVAPVECKCQQRFHHKYPSTTSSQHLVFNSATSLLLSSNWSWAEARRQRETETPFVHQVVWSKKSWHFTLVKRKLVELLILLRIKYSDRKWLS